MAAVVPGHQDVVARLLAAGADPNHTAGVGYTALYLAALKGHTDIAELLLDHGADPVPDASGDIATPAEIARRANHGETAELIDRHAWHRAMA